MPSIRGIDPLLEKQYMVRLLRDDFPQIIEAWQQRSATLTRDSENQLDIDLGSADNKLDIFYCGNSNAPLLVFLHGGYWQAGDKSYYRFVAQPYIEDGVDVAILAYPLCPTVSMTQLLDSVLNAIIQLYRNAKALGISASRICIAGHSAGGHLASVARSTNWTERDETLPIDLVKSAIAISGLFELSPLIQTSLNVALKLDKTEAHALSSMRMRSANRSPMMIILGAAETTQFHWQANQYARYLKGLGVKVEKHFESGADHFDILNEVSSANSRVYQIIRAFMQ